jgi:hypothetical protein
MQQLHCWPCLQRSQLLGQLQPACCQSNAPSCRCYYCYQRLPLVLPLTAAAAGAAAINSCRWYRCYQQLPLMRLT